MGDRHGSRAFDVAALLVLVTGSFALRTVSAWNRVFLPDATVFAGSDPWYHVRVVENTVRNFPHVIAWDSFLVHPSGGPTAVAPLFPWFIAAIAWLAGLGHPSAALIEHVAAIVPPLLGAAVVIPVYLIARTLWRKGALFAGAVIAFLPGEFFIRSLLGNPDQHVAEVLCITTVLAFVLMAIEGEAGDGRRLRCGIGAGVALSCYLLVWKSGVLMLAVLAVALGTAMVGERRSSVRAGRAADVALLTFSVALVVTALFAPFWSAGRNGVAVLLACAGAAALIRFAGRHRGVRFGPRLAIAAVAAAVALGVMWAMDAPFLHDTWLNMHRLLPRREAMLVDEALPLLGTRRGLLTYFDQFGVAGLVALAGLAIVTSDAVRKRDAGDLLLTVWSLAGLALMFAQQRFSYYFIVVVALLCARSWSWLSERFSRGWMQVAALLVIFVIVVPAVRRASERAARPDGPTRPWRDALVWMRDQTPEPFADREAYWAPVPAPRPSSYGVLAWWDFGYWITRIAHRVPLTNPTQENAHEAADALLSTDEPSLLSAMRRLGTRYLVIDDSLPHYPNMTLRSNGHGALFDTVAGWSHQPPSTYLETAILTDSHKVVHLFYPDYYRSMAVRLALFGTDGAEADAVWVVTFDPWSKGDVKHVVAIERFPSYEEALAAVNASDGNRRIAGLDPLRSCVPLAPMTALHRVWGSDEPSPSQPESPAVQVFELP